KHLQSGQGAEQKDAAREKARDEARKKLEEDTKKATSLKPPPEFGSAEDFQLAQAINQLKGKTVIASKTAIERKAEVETTN
ncbi:MAG: peptidase S41, partial [Pseudomonadota bacterium]|nr:peptidase S41 [Pseudomonadota bacterium]